MTGWWGCGSCSRDGGPQAAASVTLRAAPPLAHGQAPLPRRGTGVLSVCVCRASPWTLMCACACAPQSLAEEGRFGACFRHDCALAAPCQGTVSRDQSGYGTGHCGLSGVLTTQPGVGGTAGPTPRPPAGVRASPALLLSEPPNNRL